MNRISKTLLLTALGASSAGAGLFIKDQQYRFCENGGCTGGNADALKTGLPVIENGDGYKLVFIEYREDGQRFDDAEFQAAEQLIQDERNSVCDPSHNSPASIRERSSGECDKKYGGTITLFTYVHGWKNNANIRATNNPGDVEKFRAYLATYAKTVKPESSHPVVGVYFAWRGSSLNLPTVVNWISFWSRSWTALRVGEGGQLTKDFGDLVQMARERERAPGGAASDSKLPDAYLRSRVIVLSHSFGARVLQTALLGTALKNAFGDVSGVCKGLVNGQAQRPPVDIILFENAATGAGAVWKALDECQPCGNKEQGCGGTPAVGGSFSEAIMVRALSFDKSYCRANPNEARCQPYPLVVSLSSSQDVLTRLVLFFASGQHPASFLPWLRTHRVLAESKVTVPDRAKGDVVSFEGGDGQRWLLRRKSGHVSAANTIWTLEVPGRIVKDHGDVWNYSLMNLEINLIASTDRHTALEFQGYNDEQKSVLQPLCPSCTGIIVPLCGKGTPAQPASPCR